MSDNLSRDPMYPVTAAVNALGVHFTLWRRGGDDDGIKSAEQSLAASDAVADIDAALHGLLRLRAQLVTEIEQYQDVEPAIVPRDAAGQPE